MEAARLIKSKIAQHGLMVMACSAILALARAEQAFYRDV